MHQRRRIVRLRQAPTILPAPMCTGEGQPEEGGATPAAAAEASGGGGGEEPMDEDALLQQALAMVLFSLPAAPGPSNGACVQVVKANLPLKRSLPISSLSQWPS